MSLNASLNTAVSGLQANQSLLRVISANVSSASVEGYTKKTGHLETVVLNGVGSGVSVAGITRAVDGFLLAATNTQNSATAAADVMTDYYTRLQDLFGKPESNTSIAGTLNDFRVALNALAADPSQSVGQFTAVTAAQDVVNSLNNLSTTIQGLRGEADAAIGEGIAVITDRLVKLADLNDKIVKSTIAGEPVGDLLDKRDQALKDISDWVDIKWYMRESGETVVMTQSNYMLLDGTPRNFSYTPVAGVSASTTYPGGFAPIVLDGQNPDMTNIILSGKLSSLINLRDEVLPDLQTQLDQLAASFSDNMNRAHNSAMPIPGLTSFNGVRGIDPADQLDAGNAESIPLTAYTDPDTLVTSYGSFQIAITDENGNAVGDAMRVDIDEFKAEMEAYVLANGGGVYDYQVTLGDIINMINGAYAATPPPATPVPATPVGWPGIVPWPPSPPLTMTSTTSDIAGLTNLSGTGQAGGLSNGRFAGIVNGELTIRLPSGSPYGLAIDDTRTHFDDGSDQPATFNYLFGLNDLFVVDPEAVSAAADISLRADIAADPGRIGRGHLSSILRDPTDPATEEWYVAQGDGAGAQAMADVFAEEISFARAGNLPDSRQSLTEYAGSIIQSNSTAADAATADFSYKNDLLLELTNRLGSQSGVNVDEELAILVAVQSSYAASARVVSTVNTMYDDLLNIA